MEGEVGDPIETVRCVLPVQVWTEPSDPGVSYLYRPVPGFILLIDWENILEEVSRVIWYCVSVTGQEADSVVISGCLLLFNGSHSELHQVFEPLRVPNFS